MLLPEEADETPSDEEPASPPKNPPALRDQILADFATLRIPVTADQLDAALKQAQDAGWSHLEFLHRLLADQAGLRRQRRIERLIKDAHFREALPLNNFDWNFNPAIPRCRSKRWPRATSSAASRTSSSSASPAWEKAG